jgi:hypothetical protein
MEIKKLKKLQLDWSANFANGYQREKTKLIKEHAWVIMN